MSPQPSTVIRTDTVFPILKFHPSVDKSPRNTLHVPSDVTQKKGSICNPNSLSDVKQSDQNIHFIGVPSL